MIKLLDKLLDWLYQKNCYFCHKPAKSGLICSGCYEKIDLNPSNPIKIIKGVKVFSVSSYETTLKQLIRGLKYHNKKKLSEPLAKLIYTFWKNLDFCNEEFELVPMPLFFEREKKRGYNHVKLIADEFSKLTGYRVNTEIVKRVKNTKPQYKLSKAERIENLKDAFSINKENYNNKKLLIIDDICTSGATLEELITTFQKNNLKDLYVIVSANPS